MNKDDTPLITVGITSFNAVDTIQRALDSAINQKWPRKEIIIVDDCSTDSTWDSLQKLSSQYGIVRIFRNERNSGVATSRNRIILEAKGEFIAFFDDDDESNVDRLLLQYQRIVDYEQYISTDVLVICHTARKLFYPSGEVRYEQTMGCNIGAVAPFGIDVARRILVGERVKDAYGACPTCSQMARRSVYLDGGMFDTSFRRSEDTELNIRLAQLGTHFVGLREPLVNQFMTKTSDKSLQDEMHYMLKLIDKHKDIIGDRRRYHFCRNWIKLKYVWLLNEKPKIILLMIKLILTHPKMVIYRVLSAMSNISLNRSFSRFHK